MTAARAGGPPPCSAIALRALGTSSQTTGAPRTCSITSSVSRACDLVTFPGRRSEKMLSETVHQPQRGLVSLPGDRAGPPRHRRGPARSESRPVSRILYRRFPGGGDHPSRTDVSVRLVRPTRRLLRPLGLGGRATHASCLALLRTGFTRPRRSPGAPVSSYLTLSPLPDAEAPGGLLSVALAAGRPAWSFSSVLPCGVRTFLDPASPPRRGHPADSRLHANSGAKRLPSTISARRMIAHH